MVKNTFGKCPANTSWDCWEPGSADAWGCLSPAVHSVCAHARLLQGLTPGLGLKVKLIMQNPRRPNIQASPNQLLLRRQE